MKPFVFNVHFQQVISCDLIELLLVGMGETQCWRDHLHDDQDYPMQGYQVFPGQTNRRGQRPGLRTGLGNGYIGTEQLSL